MINLALLCVVFGGFVVEEPGGPSKPTLAYCHRPEQLYFVAEDIRYEVVMEDFEHYGTEYQNSRDMLWATVWVKSEAKNGMGYWEFAGTIMHTYAFESNMVTGEGWEIHSVKCLYRNGKTEIFEECGLDEGAELMGEKFKGEKDGPYIFR